jgi:hypothetical protein
MNDRHLSLLATLALVAACGGEPTPPDDTPTVASVTVSPASPSVKVGASQQMSVVAKDQNGGSMTVSVQWVSSDNTVATITTTGLVTAVATGTSAITATAGGVAGSQILTVVPDECAQAVLVALDPGQYQTYSASECLLLPSGSSHYYRIAITRPSENVSPSDVVDATLTTTRIGTLQNLTAPPAPQAASLADLGVLDGARFLENRAIKARTAQFQMDMLEREVRERGPGPDGLVPDRRPLGLRLMANPPSRLSINAQLSCSGTFTPATLVNFNDDLAIYQDSTERVTRPISASATQEMLDYYTSYVKQMVSDYWGAVTDIDGNGRIVITTAPTLGDSVAATVFTGDLRTSGTCAASNLAEIIYFNADLILDMDGASPDWLALSTIAHEIKHLVSIRHRFAAGTGLPPAWIEEGTAEISATMSSRIAWAATGGPAVGSAITGDDLIATLCATDPCAFTKELYAVVDNLANAIAMLSTQPNSLVTNPTGANEFHSIYSSGWHFHRFIADAFGSAATPFADAPLFRQLTDSTTALGTAGLAQVTGRSFGQLFEDMVVAMSLHNTPAPQPTRAFTTYDWITATGIFAAPAVLDPPGFYPWPVTVNTPTGSTDEQLWMPFASTTFKGKIGPSGMRFHDFQSDGTGTGLQVEITMGGSSSVIVTRIR